MSDQIRAEPPRERIIKAARKLFDATGFHTATTAELAAAAAVSIGQIYRLFENQDDVVLALVEANTQARVAAQRSQEHTSEPPSVMRNSYAVLCLQKQSLNTDSAY